MTDKPAAVPVLMSYAYLKNASREVTREIVTDPRMELLLDSGAFSAFAAGHEIHLSEYINWLEEWGGELFGYLALDVVQDPEGTQRNLDTMYQAGFQPIPVHVLGDTKQRMDELFEMSEWVALAGLLRPGRGHGPASYVAQKMKWADGRKVHWLGYTREPMLLRYRPFSCDCSSWKAGLRYGSVRMYLGRGKWINMTYPQVRKDKLYLRQDVQAGLATYGFTVEQFLDPHQWRVPEFKPADGRFKFHLNDTLLSRIPARSWCRYVLEFKERFGTRIFLASDQGNMGYLNDALAWVAQWRASV